MAMRGLAEFAMRGPYRALLVAMAGAGSLLFCWISAAVVALVALQRGPKSGFWVLLWASLPALVLIQLTGDATPLSLLVGTALLAMVLQVTMSLSLAVLLSGAVGLLTGVLFLAVGQAMLEQVAAVFAEFFQALEEQARQGEGAESLQLVPPTVPQLAGMMGAANAMLSVLCLALGRYWQSALYHPGAFGAEFRELRFPPAVTLGLAIAAFALAFAGVEFRSWAACLLVPLTAVGFALVHSRAKLAGQGSLWLTGVYLIWLVFDVAKLVLVGAVLVDAQMNFRARWKAARGLDKQRRTDDGSSE
jgi:hypothetical protein